MNVDRRRNPPKPSGTQDVVFRLTRAKRDALRDLARASHVRLGELVTMAIEDVLRKHGEDV